MSVGSIDEATEGGLRSDLPWRWLGGHLCLDFANTVAWASDGVRQRPRPEYERLTGYGRLVEWGQLAGILSDLEAEALLEEARDHPADARGALAEAERLREAIHALFADIAHGRDVDPTALTVMNAALREGMARIRVARANGGFHWEWMGGTASLVRPLWIVAWSAAELLVSSDRLLVRECSGEDCGFLFLDRSPTHNRRWCDMAHCGNRAKVQRYRQRRREQS